MIRGRGFEDADLEEGAEPVLMVSERFASEVWPGLDPLTQCGRLGREDPPDGPPQPCRRVIGVFSDIVRFDLSEDPAIAFAAAAGSELRSYWGLVVRTERDPEAVLPTVRSAVFEVDDDIRFVDIETFAHMRDDEMGSWRMGAVMFSAFGGLALLLAALGLYSVLAFNVAQRYRELGIRAALGASARGLVGMIAAFLPAWRVTRVDPTKAIQAE